MATYVLLRAVLVDETQSRHLWVCQIGFNETLGCDHWGMPLSRSIANDATNACRRALHSVGVLDGRQEDFSRVLASAAASMANTSIAVIGVIDGDRQWLKGSHGLSLKDSARVVDFCLDTIAKSGPLFVADVTRDARFSEHRLVKGSPYIRLLAGLPLTIAGHRMGALCVIDPYEREMTKQQMAGLAKLAQDTSAWLEDFMLAL